MLWPLASDIVSVGIIVGAAWLVLCILDGSVIDSLGNNAPRFLRRQHEEFLERLADEERQFKEELRQIEEAQRRWGHLPAGWLYEMEMRRGEAISAGWWQEWHNMKLGPTPQQRGAS